MNLSLPTRDTLYRYRGWIIGLVIGAIFCTLLVAFLPSGNDYNLYYYPSADKWLHGETRLYDNYSEGYYNAPWMLLLYFPFTIFPMKFSLILANIVALLTIFISMWLLRRLHPTPDWAVMAAVVNMFIFALLFLGQVDWLLLLGAVLGWWGIAKRQPWTLAVGFWLLSMKPLNVILVGILYLISIRSWRMGEIARTLSLTVFSVLICFPLIGWDYPMRYIESAQDNPPDAYRTATIWKLADAFGLPPEILIIPVILAVLVFLWVAWKYQTEAWTVALAVATNLTISNYAYGHHYVILIPAFFYVASRSTRLAVLAYILMWAILWGGIVTAFAFFPDALQKQDFLLHTLYPLLLFASLWWLERERLTARRLRPADHPL